MTRKKLFLSICTLVMITLSLVGSGPLAEVTTRVENDKEGTEPTTKAIRAESGSPGHSLLTAQSQTCSLNAFCFQRSENMRAKILGYERGSNRVELIFDIFFPPVPTGFTSDGIRNASFDLTDLFLNGIPGGSTSSVSLRGPSSLRIDYGRRCDIHSVQTAAKDCRVVVLFPGPDLRASSGARSVLQYGERVAGRMSFSFTGSRSLHTITN